MKTFIKIMIIVCYIMVAACLAWLIFGICVKETSIIVTGACCTVVNAANLAVFITSYKML